MDINGLLYSQIGYDTGDLKRGLFRSNNAGFLSGESVFSVCNAKTGEAVLEGKVAYWGEIWKIHWWELDFSSLEKPGEYTLRIRDGEREILPETPFRIGRHLLWNESVTAVALDQMEERQKRARNGKGWKDCGSYWREVNSHAVMVIGLCDLLHLGFERMDGKDRERLIRQITVGCDYISVCQDKAERLGHPEGAIIHEIPDHLSIIPSDISLSAVALAKASRLLADVLPDRSSEYLRRAANAMDYLIHKAEPHEGNGFSHWNHGAPEDFTVPREWMTRDMMTTLWGCVELWIAGRGDYKEEAVAMARKIMKRQVPKSQKEGGFYGHFYTFDRGGFTEKANIHHHCGHDTGGILPHYIIPFIEMSGRWHDHPDAPLWEQLIQDFAYGYFLPACEKNPFYIVPEGYFTGEGLLVFCGPWHGINTTICFAASLAAQLEGFTGDPAFRKLAVGGLQWIAGLNPGITEDSFGGCVMWRDTVEPGKALPYSQIVGIGQRHVGAWAKIKGTIPNGFSVNPQFKLTVKPSLEADGPRLYTDEDWIPHGAGWLSALSYLYDIKRYSE